MMQTKTPNCPRIHVPKPGQSKFGLGVWVFGFLGISLLLSGCGDSNLPNTVSVTGKVTIDGAPCPGPGSLRFSPISVEEGLPRRPGRAEFDTDSKFQVTSFREGDGLVPGTYRVQLECWQTPPASGQPGVSYLASGFQPPELVVGRDQGSVTYNVDAPSAAD